MLSNSLMNWLLTLSEIDECTLGTDNCHEKATCANTAGSFICTCIDGYSGDGVTCAGKNVNYLILLIKA